MMRGRLAPRAYRIDISRARAAERRSKRVATLMAHMATSSPAMLIRRMSGVLRSMRPGEKPRESPLTRRLELSRKAFAEALGAIFIEGKLLRAEGVPERTERGMGPAHITRRAMLVYLKGDAQKMIQNGKPLRIGDLSL
jgi:hypothetical protein